MKKVWLSCLILFDYVSLKRSLAQLTWLWYILNNNKQSHIPGVPLISKLYMPLASLGSFVPAVITSMNQVHLELRRHRSHSARLWFAIPHSLLKASRAPLADVPDLAWRMCNSVPLQVTFMLTKKANISCRRVYVLHVFNIYLGGTCSGDSCLELWLQRVPL